MEINDRNLQQFDNISGRFDIIKALVEMFPKSKNIEIAFLGYSDLMHTSEEWEKWTDNQNTKLEKEKSRKIKNSAWSNGCRICAYHSKCFNNCFW